MPNLSLPGKQTAYAMGAASIVLAVVRVFDIGKVWRRVTIGLVLFFFVIALLCWAYAGSTNTFNVINLFQGTLADSIPLILGALAGLPVRTVRRDQHRDRGPAAAGRVRRGGLRQRVRGAVARDHRRVAWRVA